MAWQPVAGAQAIAPGQFLQIDTGSLYLLICNVDGELFAIEDQCTHDGSSMVGGCLQGDEIICPHHGARFCVRTGAVTAPPAYEAIQTFPVRINDKNIEVDLP